MERVTSIEHLNTLIKNGKKEYFIMLNFGLRSSKDISFGNDESVYNVFNHIDDSEQTLTKEELFDTTKTNIGKALNCGALFAY